MIDKHEFATAMGMLADRFGRRFEAPTSRAYFAILAAELTTEEFRAGVAGCLRDCAFWPSPKEIIERARPSAPPGLSAAEAWERVHRIAAGTPGGTRRSWAEKLDAIADLGAAAVRAFNAVGGRARWTDLVDDDVKWLRKEFVALYPEAESHASREADAAKLLEASRARIGGGLTAIGASPTAQPARRIAPGAA